MDLFQVGKGICQGFILSPCLFNFYAEYILRNAGLEEAQAGIKISGRNINKFRYADDNTLMAESRGTQEPLDESNGGEWKNWFKSQLSKKHIHGIQSHHSWQIDGETVETVTDFIFLSSKITADGDCSHEIKTRLLLGRQAMTMLDSLLKFRDITLLTKVQLVKAMVFPLVMYGCESWIIKKAEHRGIDSFELWCWRRLFRVLWTPRSN